jgi:4-hydroxy-tetrahydrodipicolinate synthase
MASKKTEGVIIAIPSPLTKDEDIDIPSLRSLLEYCINEGANGVMILGTMGEGAALLDSQRQLLIEATVDQVRGRIPVLATATGVSTKKNIEYARAIDDCGVDYIVCTSPYYYKFPDPESLIQHIERITDVVETPVIFYNAPIFTGNPVHTDTLERILNMERVAGIKDSSCNYGNFVELLRRYPDRNNRPGTIMQGDESVYDSSLLMGADGVVSGGGVAFIKLLKELYLAGASNDRIRSIQIQRDFTKQLTNLLSTDPQRNWLYSIKKQLVDTGVISNAYVTAPFIDSMAE